MDDELRMKATDFIQTKFLAILETREFLTLPTIKLELIGKHSERERMSEQNILVQINRFDIVETENYV